MNFIENRNYGYRLGVNMIIVYHLISMGTGPTVLKSDWWRAGLHKDLLVFVLCPTKTGNQVHVVSLILTALNITQWRAKIHRKRV